jgi:diaminohydroxyphosphoribosylaminopyrimidine deaminase / 5-amino-6-(5-phosphoribosylamino)uracil reductase
VLTGIGTVLADDPRMNVRGVDTPRQPLKVVVDSRLRTPPGARMLAGGALIVAARAEAGRAAALGAVGAEVLPLGDARGRVDLVALLDELGRRGVNELHVEAGATLNGALLAAGLVDEWVAYLAPLAMGHQARGLFELPELTTMEARRAFRATDTRLLGDDLRLTLRPA